MLRVPLNQALPGMRLALPVLHPQRGSVLLTEGYGLDEPLIRRLRAMEVGDLWVEYPDTVQIKQYVSPAILNQQTQVIGMVADMFDSVHRDAHAEIGFIDYRKTIQGLIEALVSEPAAASYIVELGGGALNELRHASEVCLLSVLLGLKLQGYLVQQRKRLLPKDARDVVSLGLGAMLHDIGISAMDPQIRMRWEQMRDDRDPEWRAHVTLGHKMMSGAIPPAAAGVILHHHQHYDGSGFPTTVGFDKKARGLAGDDIHVFARIVCVANHFDRMRRPAQGDPQPRVRVLKNMLAGRLTSRFDPVILASLPLVVPAYPPGSVVTLSNGEKAVVTAWHPEAPCQPTVQLLPDSTPQLLRGTSSQPIRYDLRDRTDLLVVEHEGSDVSRDNFRLISAQSEPQKSAA